MAKKNAKWFEAGKPMGWHKTQSQSCRRWHALRAHKGDYLATARALGQLASVNQDAETRRKARNDSRYFYDKYRKSKGIKRK